MMSKKEIKQLKENQKGEELGKGGGGKSVWVPRDLGE